MSPDSPITLPVLLGLEQARVEEGGWDPDTEPAKVDPQSSGLRLQEEGLCQEADRVPGSCPAASVQVHFAL